MALKKWITKAELKEILNTYSVRKDEFKEISEYAYISNFVKGYMITVSEEFLGNDRTGRIIVAHTKGNGKKSFNDIWERDKENKLQFKFRNPFDCPVADAYYIRELENENGELRKAGRMQGESSDRNLYRRIRELEEQVENLQKIEKIQKESLKKDADLVDSLYKKIKELEKGKQTQNRKHNERNAGRKKADEKWSESFARFIALYESQKSINEIMGEMQISRATYFRYKKLYSNTQV